MNHLLSKYCLLKWAPLCVSILFLLTWLYSHLAQSIYISLNFDGFIADGPFQLYNPLRRLAAGQTAGVDFQFFHGLGVPLLHYPLFALFGKTIFGSELSRNITSLLAFFTSLFIFGYVVTEKSFSKALYVVISAICLLEFLNFDGLDSFGHPLATSGNSLLGIRSTFPIFTFAIFFSQLRPVYKAMAAGSALAVSFFCGTEHGLSLIASYLLINILYLAKHFRHRASPAQPNDSISWHFLGLSLCFFVFSLLLLYSSFSKLSAIGQILRYNLIEVPADQFWYFGVAPNDYATSLAGFAKLHWPGICIFLGVMLWLGAQLYTDLFSTNIPLHRESMTISHMLCYGLLSCASCLGMLEPGYLMPMTRIFVLAILAQAFKKDRLAFLLDKLRGQNLLLRRGAVTFLSLLSLWFLGTLSFISIKRLPPTSYLTEMQFPQQFSVAWSKHLKIVNDVVSMNTKGGHLPSIWSTYAGLLEGNQHSFLPREDYIIHALGSKRRANYVAAFREMKPDLVQTLRRSHFLTYTKNRDYEQWLRNTSWPLYEDILNNYEIAAATDRSYIWRRKSNDWAESRQSFQSLSLAFNNDSVVLSLPEPVKPDSLVIIRLRYQIQNPWKKLPFVGGFPRYIVKIENAISNLPVSLPPYEEEAQFSLKPTLGCTPKLIFETQSLLPGATFIVTGISYKILYLSEKQLLFLTD